MKIAGTVVRNGEKVFESVNLTVLPSTAVTAPGFEHAGEEVGRALVDASAGARRNRPRRWPSTGEPSENFASARSLIGDLLASSDTVQLSASSGMMLPSASTLTEAVVEVHGRHVVGVVGNLGRIDGAENLHRVHGHGHCQRRRRPQHQRGNGGGRQKLALSHRDVFPVASDMAFRAGRARGVPSGYGRRPPVNIQQIRRSPEQAASQDGPGCLKGADG